MNKALALTLANADITTAVAATRQSGKAPEAEVAKFEKMCQAVLAKGESLGDEFFSKLQPSASGRDIFRAIHAA